MEPVVEWRSLGPFSVTPIGFGAMRLTGPNVFGPPRVAERPIACVQNLFQVTSRESQPVLEECTRREIAFVPFGSLGFGVTGPEAVLRRREVVEEAGRLGVTPAQVVLAWTLALAPNMLLIPGSSSVDHLCENLAASAVRLDPEAVDRLSAM